MHTLRLAVDPLDLTSPASAASLRQAAEILRNGGTVALPTETVYGLGANALNPNAVAKIFAAKQRPSWDPLIVHISDISMLRLVVSAIPPAAEKLMSAFWPGPLTLLLPKCDTVPDAVTAGRARVGVRMPQHPVASALIREAGIPIAAPSANRFGRTSPTTAEHVLEDLDGSIDAVLDSGETTHGLESTVVDACEDPFVVYRPGVVTVEQMRGIGVEVAMFRETAQTTNAAPESLPSPGVGLRHYAPKAKLILIEGEGETQRAAFLRVGGENLERGEKVGWMQPEDFPEHAEKQRAVFYRWGRWNNAEELAQRLFAGLRFLDKAGATVIVCPLPSATGIGAAMRDRLLKAARRN